MKYTYIRSDSNGSENRSLAEQMKALLAGGYISEPDFATTKDADLNLEKMIELATENGIDQVVISSIDQFDDLKFPLDHYKKLFHDAGITVTFSDEHSQAVWDSTPFLSMTL